MAGRTSQKILITGAHGQLGRSLTAACTARGIAHEGRDIDTLDICDARAVRRWIVDSRPSVVVNTAAFTAVDACEDNEEQATAVNGTAVGHLAAACNEAGALLIQISTDYVFSGDASSSVRRRGRGGAEQRLRSFQAARRRTRPDRRSPPGGADGLALRPRRPQFRRGHPHPDRRRRAQPQGGGRPARLPHVLRRPSPQRILDLAAAGSTGTIHAVNAGSTTWHGFAVEIARLLGSAVDDRAGRNRTMSRGRRRDPPIRCWTRPGSRRRSAGRCRPGRTGCAAIWSNHEDPDHRSHRVCGPPPRGPPPQRGPRRGDLGPGVGGGPGPDTGRGPPAAGRSHAALVARPKPRTGAARRGPPPRRCDVGGQFLATARPFVPGQCHRHSQPARGPAIARPRPDGGGRDIGGDLRRRCSPKTSRSARTPR